LAALLLLSSACYSVPVYDGPALPGGWDAIFEQQGTELETTFAELASQSQELRMQLNTALLQLDAAQKSLTNSTRQLDAASAYLKTFETKVRTLTIQRNIAIVTTVAAAVIAVVAFIW